MKTRSILLALVLSFGAAACGSDADSSADGADRIEELTEAFTSLGAPEDEARCVAERLPGDTSVEQVRTYVEAVLESDDPTAIGDAALDVAVAIGEAAGECTS